MKPSKHQPPAKQKSPIQEEAPTPAIPNPAPHPIVLSAIERAIQMQKELDEVRQEAIKELQTRQEETAAQLRMLGYNQPTPQQSVGGWGTKKTYQKKESGQKFCPICQLVGHDGRQHRQQGPTKRPFTKDELAQFGLPAEGVAKKEEPVLQ
jgi:hypothetical protein